MYAYAKFDNLACDMLDEFSFSLRSLLRLDELISLDSMYKLTKKPVLWIDFGSDKEKVYQLMHCHCQIP